MGIQQKLHTKLVQKLILTPSLQQAIKLLPMSTLELSDLLTQEMVENPMLEEVPTEELHPADTAATPEKPEPEQPTGKADTWDDQDYEYFFGDYLDDGYLVASFDELAAMGPWPVAEVERALRLLQSFDPTGVAARDLQECLLLQLRHLGLEGTPTEKIITDHLRLLQNHQVPEIARKLGMTIDDLK